MTIKRLSKHLLPSWVSDFKDGGTIFVTPLCHQKGAIRLGWTNLDHGGTLSREKVEELYAFLGFYLESCAREEIKQKWATAQEMEAQ